MTKITFVFQNNDSDTNIEVGQGSETRRQSSPLASPQVGEGMDKCSAQREWRAEGDREEGNIKVFLHVLNVVEGMDREIGK